MRTGIIYRYLNIESGKSYVGQTLHPEKRFNEHKNSKKRDWHVDYQKNPDKYEYMIIEDNISEDKLDEREIYWISYFDSFRNGYNLNEGGGGNRGHKLSDDHKRKLSEANKGKEGYWLGKHLSEDHKRKLSETHKGDKNPFYGKHHSEETLIKLRGENHPMYGKHHSEEAKKKMSDAHKGENNPFYGKHHSEETRQKLSIKNSNPSLETRKKISEHHADVSGENNPMYGKRGELSPMYGRKWFNNGEISKFCFECPEGFTEGRLKWK